MKIYKLVRFSARFSRRFLLRSVLRRGQIILARQRELSATVLLAVSLITSLVYLFPRLRKFAEEENDETASIRTLGF